VIAGFRPIGLERVDVKHHRFDFAEGRRASLFADQGANATQHGQRQLIRPRSLFNQAIRDPLPTGIRLQGLKDFFILRESRIKSGNLDKLIGRENRTTNLLNRYFRLTLLAEEQSRHFIYLAITMRLVSLIYIRGLQRDVSTSDISIVKDVSIIMTVSAKN